MSQVTIVITDNEDGEVDVKSFFEPPLKTEGGNPADPAHVVAVSMMMAVKE